MFDAVFSSLKVCDLCVPFNGFNQDIMGVMKRRYPVYMSSFIFSEFNGHWKAAQNTSEKAPSGSILCNSHMLLLLVVVVLDILMELVFSCLVCYFKTKK